MKLSAVAPIVLLFHVDPCPLARPASILAHKLAEQPALRICTDEAEAVLRILAIRGQGLEPGESEWSLLFSAEGYRRLKERESAMDRSFDEAAFDSTFKRFVLSEDLLKKAPELRETLMRWRSVNIDVTVSRVLRYLPASTPVEATIYFVVKPLNNSFVFDLDRDPAIFLHVDPALGIARIENTLAHELHHVGLRRALKRRGSSTEELASPVGLARAYLGAFGEGFAMLAAAGGPHVHPHAASLETERDRWDADMSRFPQDFRAVETFLLDVASGRLSPDEAQKKAIAAFWGDAQGAWYTVGYRMSLLIEEYLGRARLLECMEDSLLLLPAYNEAARIHNKTASAPLPLWSEQLLATLRTSSPRG